MTNPHVPQVLSRVNPEEFFGREAELAFLHGLTDQSIRGSEQSNDSLLTSIPRRAPQRTVLLGRPRVGKSELLRRTFDRAFNERSGFFPFYYSFAADRVAPVRFARDYIGKLLSQFIAFRQGDARLINASEEPLASLARAALPEDYTWLRGFIDSLIRVGQSSDPVELIQFTLAAPMILGSRSQTRPFILLDNFDLISDQQKSPDGTESLLCGESLRAITGNQAVLPPSVGYVVTGLRRPILEVVPSDAGFLESLATIKVAPLTEDQLDRFIRTTASRSNVGVSDSTAELMMHQLGNDVFYIRALFDRAAVQGKGLRTFMDFERAYTEELVEGRISYYLDAMLRTVAPDPGSRRAALESLNLVIQAGSSVPVEVVLDRMSDYTAEPRMLLQRMHSRELLSLGYGYIEAPEDPVLADYVLARHRTDIAGVRKALAGEELLRDKLKHSYRLMMSRYNRSVEAQLVESLSKFDFQGIPATILDHQAFEARYRGMSRVQVRRTLEDETERVRLPQIVLVNSIGPVEQAASSWSAFAASGFEGGIYSDANETAWLIALINTREPLDLELLALIDQRINAGLRTGFSGMSPAGRVVRWYISKEGFSAAAAGKLAAPGNYTSTYLQLDLLHDYLTRLAPQQVAKKPITEFELVIPVEDEAELIAARTAEQIARAADFSTESINQIKTALIEACINAAEHGDSPDRKIHQKFAIEDDRLVIKVSNKGRGYQPINGESNRSRGSSRGRGLQIIRALMDEVYFERSDDGTTLVMSKLIAPSEAP